MEGSTGRRLRIEPRGVRLSLPVRAPTCGWFYKKIGHERHTGLTQAKPASLHAFVLSEQTQGSIRTVKEEPID